MTSLSSAPADESLFIKNTNLDLLKNKLLEKLSIPGGNTMVSGGGLNAAVEADYKKAGIEDSPQLHTKQTMAAGDFRADPALVATLCENVPQSVEWLKKVGVQFKPGIYQIYGGL